MIAQNQDHDVAVTSQAIAKNLPPPPPDPSTQSRYTLRQKDLINYKKLNDGTSKCHFLTQGNTAFSLHMLEDHDEGDVQISVIGREKNWWIRGVKEALHINRIQPTENEKLKTVKATAIHLPVYIKPKSSGQLYLKTIVAIF